MNHMQRTGKGLFGASTAIRSFSTVLLEGSKLARACRRHIVWLAARTRKRVECIMALLPDEHSGCR